MRKFAVLGSILLLSAFGFGQNWRGIPGFCPYGCAPYVPLITTPSLSLVTVSPNPMGATNATGGLIAGATNSTLSEIAGNTDAVYTAPLWYSGGQTPIISPIPEEELAPNRPWHEQGMRGIESENRPEPGRMRRHMEPGQEIAGEHPPQQVWIYIGAAEQPAAAAAGGQKAKRTYTNDDVTRQNQQNGIVKYDGKTEKI